MAKGGLGRGLAALIPGDDEDETPIESESPKTVAASFGVETFIALEKLKANPDQPRKSFDNGELAELADSIKEHGVIQPIIVEESDNGNYIIVAGERRSRAARIAGLTEVPVIIRKYSDEKRMVVALIENVQRADLNPIEEAGAYKRLMELTGLSQDEAAEKVGKNRSTVANALRLLKLPREMQQSLQEGGLTPGHARALLSVNSAGDQDLLFREILAKGLSVRETERRAGLLNGQNKKKEPEQSHPKGRAPELGDMEEKFIGRLGTKVAINGNLKAGKIVIDYYSMEDLDRLYGILGG